MNKVLELDSQAEIEFGRYTNSLEAQKLTKDIGKISEVTGFLLKGFLPGACIGSVVKVFPKGKDPVLAEVIGFKDRSVLFMPLGDMNGIGHGAKVELDRPSATVRLSPGLLGRVVDGLGEPIDGKGPIEARDERSIYQPVGNPMDRAKIQQPFATGIRSIDGFLTVGRGQRVSILAGSGVGKSVLLGMIAKKAESDVNVIALVGERGREVKDFIENELGEEGLKKSVVVVATSDQSPLARMRAAFLATTVAEYFGEQGNETLMVMDSLTRFAMAQREIGLNVGEPPASKGYTPSVFSLLPKLLERAGSFEGRGSITGIYTVLVEGDDMDEPIADAVRSIVDGHIVLSRDLAQRGHYPAIDVLQSASRVMKGIIAEEQWQNALRLRECLALYNKSEDLINIGAYKPGANQRLDVAVELNQELNDFLKQSSGEVNPLDDTFRGLDRLASRC